MSRSRSSRRSRRSKSAPAPISRLRILLSRIRLLRKNLYPEGWEADPLRWVEEELENIIKKI